MAIPKGKNRTRALNPQESGAINESTPEEGDFSPKILKCPKCGFGFIVISDGKSKMRTRVLIFTENGNAMGICPKCKTNLKVPVLLTNQTSPKGGENNGEVKRA